MMNNKILLVDDEEDILEFLGYNLKKEGFDVYKANNGREALKNAATIVPDLIILDVMMPGMDGIETCIELRKNTSLARTMIIFLTARSEDYSQLAGFEAGADDYITKPIKPKIFISKVKALLKRVSKNGGNYQQDIQDRNEIKNLIIDRERFIVIKDGKEIILTKKEFELLELLASKPNKVFTREEIYNNVWGSNVIVGDRTIDVHIRKLREKVDISNIVTIKGVGYKYEN
ncbi:MAG: DNA-binding response regulator [Bacteroidetes bacterium GWE2_29_8]|nr:MAG: DNA-binding response regulator [Bacteroidetes bacterium GWE2_29_8]OFY13772.1 MAG: DNA-binding response regulator [Bacteroidetes bacterium GWF2_29_10]